MMTIMMWNNKNKKKAVVVPTTMLVCLSCYFSLSRQQILTVHAWTTVATTTTGLSSSSSSLLLSSSAISFAPINRRIPSLVPLRASTVDQNEERHKIVDDNDGFKNVLAGVDEFDRWFERVPGSNCVSSIQHEDFGNLRGLGWKKVSSGNNDNGGQQPWMTIPRSVVLESDFSKPDWDAQLALKLWDHVVTSSSSSSSSSDSDLSGYIALLTRGWDAKQDLASSSSSVPPSTAVDSLRHWTEEQKQMLLVGENPAGRRLLDLLRQQEESWKRKYDDVKTKSSNTRTNILSWEQFVWAMEVVHSRAFCGDFGLGGSQQLPPVVTIASPLVAAIAGYVYYVTMHGQQDFVLVGLAAVAGLPALINIISSSHQSSNVAVLLPLIDSANHREDADSVIEYSPLQNAFTLSGGQKCIVEESDGKTQLYISYGKKKDTECLLNYGFLPSPVVASGMAGDATSRRRRLAEQFLARNKA